MSLVFIRDKRFFSRPSDKFVRKREKHPYPGGRKHYVLAAPPLGIMYLSAVLKQAGHAVTMTDQCHPEYSTERYLESLKERRPEMVGISFLSNMCYPSARDLARKVKAALPGARVVMGGVFATINARKIMETEESVDVVARGEGEGIIVDLADNAETLEGIAGITYRAKSGELVEAPDRERITDLDSVPFPDREGLDINYVAALPLAVPAVIWDRPNTALLSSRGCTFKCSYCNCPIFSHRKCIMRSAGNVLKELEEINSQGYGAFSFVDDNFLLQPKRAAEISTGISERGHSFQWACQGRPEGRARDAFGALAAAGCDVMMFGIESGSQRVLDGMAKGTRLADVEKAVIGAKQAGIGIRHGFFIVGSPGETAEELRATFKLAGRLPINSFGFNSLTAFRGTGLWRDAVDRGLIDDEEDWDKMFPAHEIYPEALDSREMFGLRTKLIKRLILRKITRSPRDAMKILGRFLKSMSLGDVYRLLTSSSSDHTRRRA